MFELKTNTAVRIPAGPAVDPNDGKTAETALDVTALSVQMYQIKTDGSAVVRTQFAPTASGGNNDMALVASSTDGVYDLELTAAQLNFLGNARIDFYDVDGFLVFWIDIHVVSAAYFDWKYGATIPSVTVSDKTGFSLSATGADLILKSSTFVQAIVAAVNEFATYGLTALNTLLVTTGIKTATTAAPTDMALNSTVAKEATLEAVAGYIDTEITTIINKTNLIPANPAAVGSAMTLAEGQAMTGTKVVIDEVAGTVKVYNGSDVLLNTYTKVTVGNSHTITRT